MSDFKDTAGRWLSNALFKETCTSTDKYVKYSLDEARQLYLDCYDPTGYDFAVKYLGGVKHWKFLKDSAVIGPIILEWEEELEILVRSKALKQIMLDSVGGKFQASKFLMDRGWDTRKAGKPSKEEVDRETRVQVKMREGFDNDIARIKRD